MSGALALALVLALPASTGGRWGVGVNSDVQGGVQAVAPGQQARPVISASATPQLSLSLLANAYTFRINYGLRVFRRIELDPVAEGTTLPGGELAIRNLQRFLLLHTMGASLSARLAAGWSLSGNTNITLGEVDVPSAANYLQNTSGAGPASVPPGTPPPNPTDSNLAALPDPDGVVETISITTNATARKSFGRVWMLDMTSAVAHSRPISEPDGANSRQTFIPIQTTLNASGNLGYKLTSKDTLKLGATGSYSTSDVGGEYLNGGGTVGWTRRMGVYTNLGLNAGVQYTAVLAVATNIRNNAQQRLGTTPVPLGSLTFNTTLLNLRWTRWSAGVSGSVSSVRNPLAGNIEPRAGLSLQTSLAFMPAWSVGVSANLTTPAAGGACPFMSTGSDPGSALGASFCQAETNLQVRVPVSYRFSKAISAGAGLTYQVYAPRFSEADFAFRFPSYTMFAQLSMATDQAF